MAPLPPTDSVSPAGAARLWPVRTIGAITFVLLTFLATGWLGYRAYLATPETAEAAPAASRHPATATRLVLFIIDAFTPTKAFDPAVMPALSGLVPEGASGIVTTGPMTTTAPCVYSLTTGRPGNLVQAIFNFHSAETRVDSLLSLTAAGGGKIALAGDPAWHRQFAWLIPAEDRHESPEPGITVERHIDAYDTEAVDFVLTKLADPRYRLFILHLGSLDAVGHMVTPLAPRYAEQMTFLDGLVRRVAAAVDRSDTLLVVTGDHGMAARGTHGGEEEARLTPYVMVGPGVRHGVHLDVPQTALTTTFTSLLGLPFLPVSESPPLTAVLDRPADATRALTTDYFTAKLAAARQLGAIDDTRMGAPAAIDEAGNRRINELLFGADASRRGLRVLALLTAALGVAAAALLAWRSVPAAVGRPALAPHLALALAAPVGIGTVATAFIWTRGLFAFRSTTIALVLVAMLLVALAVLAIVLYRSPDLLAHLARWQTSLFLPALVVLMAPLVNSHWLHPLRYFELLTIAGVALTALVVGGARPALVALVFTAAVLAAPRLTIGAWQESLALPALSLAVAALVWRRVRRRPGALAALARAAVAAAVAAAWLWRWSPSTTSAAIVLALFTIAIAAAIFLRSDAAVAAALVIGAGTALFLIMASEAHEALIFVGTALLALWMARFRLDLDSPHVLYLVAAIAIVLRVCLYFELGDQYNISSIRTAPGFVLVDAGTPLPTVIALLLLKYTLPWLLIFAMLLPSLARARQDTRGHFVDLLLLGYVARFAAVAAVVDPLRALPNGMDGIVGMFSVSWAEFLTFGIAATLASTLLHDAAPAPSLVAEAALAPALSASPRLRA